jgi:DNA-binding Lrp family transcriptional regulator
MSYVHLVPSIIDYSQKFSQLTPLDFKIIRVMHERGASSLTGLAEVVGVPEQTLSYHVRKFEKRDLVRFRSLADEAKLGLKSYSVIASTALGKEGISSRTMTCFPLWRYLAIMDGHKRGNYVRYAVPPDKERDLKTFLVELEKRTIIYDFEIQPTTSPTYPLLNLSFYAEKKGTLMFDWSKWTKDLDSFAEKETDEPTGYGEVDFDLYDLLILRCLEINARTSQRKIVNEMSKILSDRQSRKFIPLVSRRIRDRIKPKGLIRCCRTYLFPNPGPTALFFMLQMTFHNRSSLRKFTSGLGYVPYNTSYEKVLDNNMLFARFVIPSYEWPNFRKALTELQQQGHLEDFRLFFGDLTNAAWDNVEIHQMFKNETWNFSYGTAIEMLEKQLKQ